MDDVREISDMIACEANDIIYKRGLNDILKKYGTPDYTGSFALDLMTWRDLDIYLVNDDYDELKHFELGKEISQWYKPYKMSYRNEIITKSELLPRGLYWGVYTNNIFPDNWKIDIWAIDGEQAGKYAKQLNKYKAKLNVENRNVILEIKYKCCKHPEYRKKFFSMDIYRAVFENRIMSISDFAPWLQKERGIDCFNENPC